MGLRKRRKKVSGPDPKFIGRKDILDYFSYEWNKHIDEDPRFISNFSGIGGIGKSRLIRHIHTLYTKDEIVCCLDPNFDKLNDPISILKTIIRKTHKQGDLVKFDKTEKIVSRFDGLIKEAASDNKDISTQDISRQIVTAAQVGGELLGGNETGKIMGRLSDASTIALNTLFDQILTRRKIIKNDEDRLLLESPVSEITSKFIQDVNKLYRNNVKFVLSIDTYEKISIDMEQWLLRQILGEVQPIEADLRIIIAGREPLIDSNRLWHDEWGDHIYSVKLNPFTSAETKEFIKQYCQIKDAEASVDKIQEYSKGHPFWLHLWADSGAEMGKFTSASNLKKIEERFFELFPDSKHKKWLRQASFFRHFNQDLLSILIEEETQEAFSWLTNQTSLVEGDGIYWKLHDIPRKTILNNRKIRSENLFSDPVKKIVSHIEKRHGSFLETFDGNNRIGFSEDEKEILSDFSYYMTLYNGDIIERHLSVILDVSKISIDVALKLLSIAIQALKEIDVSPSQKIKTIIKIIKTDSHVVDEMTIKTLRTELKMHDFSKQQQSLLDNLIDGFTVVNNENEDRGVTVPKVDKFRKKIIEQYTEKVSYIKNNYNQKNKSFDERKLMVLAMVETTIDIRKQLDTYVEEQMNDEKTSDEVTNYLSAEYLPLEKIDFEEMPNAFAEYFLFSLTDGKNPDNLVDLKYLRYIIKKVIPYMDSRVRQSLLNVKHLFAWGKLIDDDSYKCLSYSIAGNDFLKQEKYDEAIREYSKAIKLQPELPETAGVYKNRGLCFELSEQCELALDDYNKSIELDPLNVDLYSLRSNLFLHNREYRKAIEDCDKALEMKPGSAYLYNQKAFIYDEKKEHDTAINLFDKAIELDSQKAIFFNNRGCTFNMVCRYDKAIDDFNRAIELDSHRPNFYSNRGMSYLYKTNYKQATDDFYKALELDENYVSAYFNLSKLCISKGSYAEALKILSKSSVKAEKDKLIYHFIECISKKLYSIDTSASESNLSELLSKNFILSTYELFSLEKWIETIKTNKNQYIMNLTENLKSALRAYPKT